MTRPGQRPGQPGPARTTKEAHMSHQNPHLPARPPPANPDERDTPRNVLYIAGPMTGYADFNLPAFAYATARLTAAGYHAVNPGRHGVDPTMTWADYARRGLSELVNLCDGVALLDGWETSRGATLEFTVARALGMRIHPVHAWLDGARAGTSPAAHPGPPA